MLMSDAPGLPITCTHFTSRGFANFKKRRIRRVGPSNHAVRRVAKKKLDTINVDSNSPIRSDRRAGGRINTGPKKTSRGRFGQFGPGYLKQAKRDRMTSPSGVIGAGLPPSESPS